MLQSGPLWGPPSRLSVWRLAAAEASGGQDRAEGPARFITIQPRTSGKPWPNHYAESKLHPAGEPITAPEWRVREDTGQKESSPNRGEDDVTQGAEAGVGPTSQPERTPGTGEASPSRQNPQEPVAAASDVTFPQIARL